MLKGQFRIFSNPLRRRRHLYIIIITLQLKCINSPTTNVFLNREIKQASSPYTPEFKTVDGPFTIS